MRRTLRDAFGLRYIAFGFRFVSLVWPGITALLRTTTAYLDLPSSVSQAAAGLSFTASVHPDFSACLRSFRIPSGGAERRLSRLGQMDIMLVIARDKTQPSCFLRAVSSRHMRIQHFLFGVLRVGVEKNKEQAFFMYNGLMAVRATKRGR